MMDLKPYICVFPSCDKSQQTSRHSGDWITHMQSQHMPLEWTCIAHIHGTQTFDDAEAYIEHMKLAHVGIFADSQLPILAKRADEQGHKFSPCVLFARLHQSNVWKTTTISLREMLKELSKLTFRSI